MSLDQLVPRLAPTFAAEFLKRSVRPCRIFLSASDMKSQAVVRNASDVDPTDAFNAALDQLRSALGSVDPIILRADWITDVESMTWEEFNKLIGSTARNNFNRGVAFSPDFSIALTALEINANQLLAVADNQNGAFNLKAASSYIRARFDRELPVLEPSSPIAVFDTAGAFVLGDNAPLSVDGTQHRIVTTPDAKLIRQIMQSAVQYLESQLLSSGRFIYGRLPCTDRFVPSYNAVNHFTALLALLDAYNADGRKDDHLRESIERAIKYGVETYSDLLSDETYAPLKTAFDGFLNARTVPNVNELLAIVGADDPKAATEARAKALLDEYFWTETAMFFKCPEMIFGSFFSRDDAFRVRIDDTARALASLVEWSKHAPAVEHVDDVEVKPQIDQAVQKMVELISANRSTSPRGEAKIFFGGNTIVGRRMHLLSPTMKHLDEIPAMRAADVRIVNLLGVASALGDPVNKKYFYHMHARPEQINILTECNIDVVLTANHHAGDYGAESVLDQNKLLDEAGLGHVGAGKNIDEASAPIYVKANDLTVAIFSVDATTEEFAASEAQAGIFYMSQDALDAWTSTFDAKIAEARKHADAVFVALDWEPVSQARSFDRMRAIGRALIDSGADGVLGCDSYWYNRVEKYKERPIIYGAGLFILDGGDGDTGAYSLTVGVDGVKALTFSALRRSNGKVGVAERDKNRINDEFLARCRELGTNAKVDSDGTIEIKFSPAARPQQSLKIDEPSSIYDPLMVERHEIKPLTEPLSEWTVERVPDDAIIEPKQFDALKMVGYRVEQPVLTKYEILFVDTYWTIDAPLNKECRFYIEGKSTRENGMPFYGSGADHEFANWEFPVKRWKPGVIYRERFGLNPPRLNRLANVDLRIEIRARIDGRWLEPFIGSKTIEMRLPELPYYRRDFPEVLEHSEPGHCWTAEQLAAVTGGKWLVEPPSGWYVQSILRDMKFYNQAEAPVMFVASRRSQYLFHTEGDPASSTYDNHFMVAQYADKIAGAMIDHEVDDLPKDLPVLLVEDSVKATIELGFAARRRFKGKTIAVAGDVGKTTTVNMLEHLLKESGEVAVPFGTDELTCISAPTTFANVKAEAAYAILELSKDAIEARRGSVTYDLQPNVVVVTSNAGLEKDSEAAARVKARVFCGAVAGGYAVLNRDMKHYGIFEAAAKRHGLNVITFGRHADATVRMPELKRGESVFIDGDKYKLESALSSEQLYNALAVLAVAFAVSQGGGPSVA